MYKVVCNGVVRKVHFWHEAYELVLAEFAKHGPGQCWLDVELSAKTVHRVRTLYKRKMTYGQIENETHIDARSLFFVIHCAKRMKASKVARAWNRNMRDVGMAADILAKARKHGWA